MIMGPLFARSGAMMRMLHLDQRKSSNKIAELRLELTIVGPKSAEVLKQYPLSRFEGSPQKAFLQVDADSMVICPSYQFLGKICICAFQRGELLHFVNEACFVQPRLLQYTQAGFCSTEWDA